MTTKIVKENAKPVEKYDQELKNALKETDGNMIHALFNVIKNHIDQNFPTSDGTEQDRENLKFAKELLFDLIDKLAAQPESEMASYAAGMQYGVEMTAKLVFQRDRGKQN